MFKDCVELLDSLESLEKKSKDLKCHKRNLDTIENNQKAEAIAKSANYFVTLNDTRVIALAKEVDVDVDADVDVDVDVDKNYCKKCRRDKVR